MAFEVAATQINPLARVTQDQITTGSVVPASGVSLGADHVDILVDGVSQGRANHPGWADPVGAWSKSLTLVPGTHTITANAVHPSGHYTATASSSVTVSGAGIPTGGNITSAYDDDGNVISRTWDSGRTQTLTWDAFDRLIKVAQRDTSNNGYDWSATYDGLGRRLSTTQQTVTAGTATGSPTVTTSIYDPQVEFLEIGVAVNGAKAWKVYGPDLNGGFGSLQGTGGLEATILNSGAATKGVIHDQFGNGVASVFSGTVSWFTTRMGAYGPLPSGQAETLTDITRVAEATAWRGRRMDATGFFNLGARYYEPTSGRFLSADPRGHGASMSLYDFANGDPVNYFDADGRMGKKVNEPSAINNALSGLWAGTANGLISMAHFVKVAAIDASGAYQLLKILAPESSVVQFSEAMDSEAENLKQQVGNNIVSVTGADNQTSYLYAATEVAGETFTALLVGGELLKTGPAAEEVEAASANTPGTYRPDRLLPRDAYGNPLPEPDAVGPHTQLGKQSGRFGDYTQAREFDGNGNAVRDIDFTDHGRPDVPGHTNPHEHPYVPNPTGGTPQRGPAQPYTW